MHESSVGPKTQSTRSKEKTKPITFFQRIGMRLGILQIGLLAALVGVVIASLVIIISSHPGIALTYADFPSQGQVHIANGASHPTYNSNPPTSGWHYASPADWGIYHATLPDETLIHNLEHGGIWLSYRDANDTRTIQQLDAIANQFPDHVILTYRPTDDQAIVVAAWGHLLTMSAADSTAILDFIKRYINKGPENV